MTRRLEALYAMAGQDESPAERDIAIAKLETMGAWPPPPPKPPTRNAASPAPMPRPVTNSWTTFSTSGNATFTANTFRIRVTDF